MPTYLESPILVIGYGSQLRSDDAVGPRVADAIEQMNLPGVAVISRHQLTPELAQAVSTAELVIFVDAADASLTERVTVSPVELAATGEFPAHKCDPSSLLAVSDCVFGQSPTAWCVAVPCENFDIGEELSPLAIAGIGTATLEVERLCRSHKPSLERTP